MKSSIAVGLFFVGCLYIANALPLSVDGLDNSVDPVDAMPLGELDIKDPEAPKQSFKNIDLETLIKMKSDKLVFHYDKSTKETQDLVKKYLVTYVLVMTVELKNKGIIVPVDVIDQENVAVLIEQTRLIQLEQLKILKNDDLEILRALMNIFLEDENPDIAVFIYEVFYPYYNPPKNESRLVPVPELLAEVYSKLSHLGSHMWKSKEDEVKNVIIEFIKRADLESHRLKNTEHVRWEQLEDQVATDELFNLNLRDLTKQAFLRVHNVMTTYWDNKTEQVRRFVEKVNKSLDEKIQKYENFGNLEYVML